MATETQIVKEYVRKFRGKKPQNDYATRELLGGIHNALTRDDLPGRFDNRNGRRDRQYMAHRLLLRIMKKLRQPFRRKDRGPLRRRAAGKNEVTRREA
jgi:hypothetical protein